ncbi:PorT family protein [Ancylomarina euxinus]|uniref:PorT family protein n=1 Tax=Ancylomarina euxinus TaxID=2283627 RepID=A0A425XYM0_9BACT|nr:porin family protein [Ancylomarina euxinus]MCZ4695733.1 porin family protein [Ancylomarina euxinus]MUP16186.1 outer membrane beta-barrel protein [Ancylomarina euxinus]RRG20047.1 PorT family protein [Ancylomarina euxinus]
MKKLLLVAVICLFSSALFAQLASPISLGIHGGLVSTKLETNMSSSSIKENAENGMMLGAFARININKWYIQPELNYVKRKSSIEQSFMGADIKMDVETKSIDIPVLLGYKIVKLPLFKLRAFAGPVASFNIDDKIKTTLGDVEDGNFKSAVWNAKVGAGVDVWKLTLDVDYEFGLTDVSSEFLKKNKMVNVTLGFRLF